MWIDENSNKIVTAEQLRNEFETLKREQPEEYSYTFEEYIENCTERNGTLKPYELPFC